MAKPPPSPMNGDSDQDADGEEDPDYVMDTRQAYTPSTAVPWQPQQMAPYGHSIRTDGMGLVIDPLLVEAAQAAPSNNGAEQYRYYPPPQAHPTYHSNPSFYHPASSARAYTHSPYNDSATSDTYPMPPYGNPYLEDEPVHQAHIPNPYLDYPPSVTENGSGIVEYASLDPEDLTSHDMVKTTSPQHSNASASGSAATSATRPRGSRPAVKSKLVLSRARAKKQESHEDTDPLLLSPRRGTLSSVPSISVLSATSNGTTASTMATKIPRARARSSATPIPGANPKRKPKESTPLKLGGPASTAASATTTMKNGIGKVVRDEYCSFCQGTDLLNKVGQPEHMLTCERCGRSGHPSCLSMKTASLRAEVQKYAWQCIECKVCEICKVKGDDNRLMFCDGCDRGWHSYCLNPPLSKPPKGVWKCPMCMGTPFPTTSASTKADRQAVVPLTEEVKEDPMAQAAAPGVGVVKIPRKTGKRESTPFNSRSKEKGKATTSPVPSPIPKYEQPTFVGKEEHQSTSVAAEKSASLSGSVARLKRPRIDKLRLVTSSYKSSSPSAEQAPSPPPAPPVSRPTTIIKIRIPPALLQNKEMKKRKRPSVDGLAMRRIAAVEAAMDDEPEEPFGGIIKGEDADTTRTTIHEEDKAAFEQSRKAAEALLGAKRERAQDDVRNDTPSRFESPAFTPGDVAPVTGSRLRERVLPSSNPVGGQAAQVSAMARSESHPGTTAEKIKAIRIGKFDIDTWYSAPYPEEYSRVPDGRLWLCEYCLKYMKSGFVAGRHQMKCKARHPPGDEIYRDGNISVFEVDGRKNKIYCQNLCLLAKMFLDHKTLYYDVEPFLFYVMTENDDEGARFVGYFSKEKRSPNLNVSCIMTLPVRQRKGWGNLLIDFSYLLSKKEGRAGSPEKPLSALGALSYRNYWTLTVFRYLDTCKDNPSLHDISKATSMTMEDILATLQHHGMIHIDDNLDELKAKRKQQSSSKRSSGGDGMARKALTRNLEKNRGEIVVPEHYEILWDRQAVREHLERYSAKHYLELKPEHLKYTPFLVTRITLGKDGMLHSLAIAKGQAVEVQGKEPDLISHLGPPSTATSTEMPRSTQEPSTRPTSALSDTAKTDTMDVECDVTQTINDAAPAQEQLMGSAAESVGLPASPLRTTSVTSSVSTSKKLQKTLTPSLSTPRPRRSAQRDLSISNLSSLKASPRSGRST